MKNEFARSITQLRKQNGLSQKQAAEHLGISQALLSHYEKGIRECGLDFLIKSAEFYSVSTDYLLGISENPQGSADINETVAVADNISEYPDLQKSKRQVMNSLNIIYSMVSRLGNAKVHTELNNILSIYIYHTFRLLETVSQTQNEENFEIPVEKSLILSMGYEMMCQSRLLERLDITGMTKPEMLNLQNVMSFDRANLMRLYPLYAKSMFALIDEIEHKIKK